MSVGGKCFIKLYLHKGDRSNKNFLGIGDLRKFSNFFDIIIKVIVQIRFFLILVISTNIKKILI